MLLVWDPLLLFVQTPIEHDDFIIWPDIDDILNKFNTCLILIYSNIHGNFQKTAVFRCHAFSLSKRSSLWSRSRTCKYLPRGDNCPWSSRIKRPMGPRLPETVNDAEISRFLFSNSKKKLYRVKKKKTWTIWRFICSKNGGKMVQFSNNGHWFFNGHNRCLGCQKLAVSLAVRKQTSSPKNEPK